MENIIMRKINIIFMAAALMAFNACDLDLNPNTSYNETNVKVDEESESQYSTRTDMLGLRNSMYNSWVKDIQEKGYMDWLITTETRSDNAYCGSPSTGAITAIEANNQDPANGNISRDWDWYLGQVSKANNIICNIDGIFANDTSAVRMTQREHDEWKAEALCWRAWNLFHMVQLWGDVPMITVIPPEITSENVEEVYEAYYPKRTPVDEVYGQIIEDLDYACENAPAVNTSDKMVFTKAFAHGMRARVYAEKQRQDWNKVIEDCDAVEGMGFKLLDNYGDLWGYDDDDAFRNSAESIFEVTWTRNSGNWVWMMYHRNAYNPSDSYTWAKWSTPSRNLAAAYDAAGDTERKNASIIYDECGWSLYYPSGSYAFMHKVPTNASSVILMRLGEIYLLHAEALAMTGDLENAAAYVNKTRNRAGLANLPNSAKSSQASMLQAVLDERRLELAFEGFRFFDLARHDMIKEVHDAMSDPSSSSYDSYWQTRTPLTDETILFPVPQDAIDKNSNLVQNPGY